MNAASPPMQFTVGTYKQVTIPTLHKVTSMLVAPLKFIYSSIQASDILVLTLLTGLSDIPFFHS
jgi:hypothetical protein